MNEFTEKFHAGNGGKYPYIKVSEIKISIDGKKTIVHVLFDKRRGDEYKAARLAVLNEIKSLLPPNAYPEFEETAVEANAETVGSSIYKYFKENNVFLMYAVTKEMMSITTGSQIVVKFILTESVFQYFVRGGYKEKLTDYLRGLFFCTCEIELSKKSEDTEEIKKALSVTVRKPRYSYEREDEGRVIIPTEREKLAGELIEDNAMYIEDCNSAQNYAVMCGNISDYKIREYTSKDDKLKKFATFTLTDATGSIRCSFFPRVGDDGKLERLQDGEFLLVSGKTEFDEYLHDGSVKLSVRRITFAKMQSGFSVNSIIMLPNDDYYYVKPAKKLYAEQFSLQENDRVSSVAAPLVVFELRTAAVSGRTGVLLEIGAVKITGGRIMQTFGSLIKPEVKLPEKLVKLLGINEMDYLRCPSAEQVIPDFYLFTQGCDITAYPSAENFSALSAAYRKLHIPFARNVDISTYISDIDILSGVKLKAYNTAALFAEEIAKKLL